MTVGTKIKPSVGIGFTYPSLALRGASAALEGSTSLGGQPVVISLSSMDFDTYLYLLDANGSVIAQNDDNITGSSSRIPANSGFFILPATGAFTTRAHIRICPRLRRAPERVGSAHVRYPLFRFFLPSISTPDAPGTMRPFDVKGTHTYLHGGDQTASITITGSGNGTASASTDVHVGNALRLARESWQSAPERQRRTSQPAAPDRRVNDAGIGGISDDFGTMAPSM